MVYRRPPAVEKGVVSRASRGSRPSFNTCSRNIFASHGGPALCAFTVTSRRGARALDDPVGASQPLGKFRNTALFERNCRARPGTGARQAPIVFLIYVPVKDLRVYLYSFKTVVLPSFYRRFTVPPVFSRRPNPRPFSPCRSHPSAQTSSTGPGPFSFSVCQNPRQNPHQNPRQNPPPWPTVAR